MSYSTELAKILTNNLTRFATLNVHQLAGHAANLDFWLAEARRCIEIIDGYATRFATMKEASLAMRRRREPVRRRPGPFRTRN